MAKFFVNLSAKHGKLPSPKWLSKRFSSTRWFEAFTILFYIEKNVQPKVEHQTELVLQVLAFVAHVSIDICMANSYYFKVSLYIIISVRYTTCNSTSSENYTWLYQAATTSMDPLCDYKICPCSSDICRIRYDFSVSKTKCLFNSKMSKTLMIFTRWR